MFLGIGIFKLPEKGREHEENTHPLEGRDVMAVQEDGEENREELASSGNYAQHLRSEFGNCVENKHLSDRSQNTYKYNIQQNWIFSREGYELEYFKSSHTVDQSE